MISHQTVEEMHIVFAKSAQVEEFVNIGCLESQLLQTCRGTISADGTSRLGKGGNAYILSSELRMSLCEEE